MEKCIFETKVVDFLIEQTIQGVVCSNGKSFESRHLILATGHSARDIYRLLNDGKSGRKQTIRHGCALSTSASGGPSIPPQKGPASSRLSTCRKLSSCYQNQNRGVHSFCMCPGGFIVPAATENHGGSGQRDEPFQKGFPFANRVWSSPWNQRI